MDTSPPASPLASPPTSPAPSIAPEDMDALPNDRAGLVPGRLPTAAAAAAAPPISFSPCRKVSKSDMSDLQRDSKNARLLLKHNQKLQVLADKVTDSATQGRLLSG